MARTKHIKIESNPAKLRNLRILELIVEQENLLKQVGQIQFEISKLKQEEKNDNRF